MVRKQFLALRRIRYLVVKSLVVRILRRLNLRTELDSIFSLLRFQTSTFPTYELRKFDYNVNNYSGLAAEIDSQIYDVGLVLQGPINHKADFTYRTVLRYLKCFPNAVVILSTWEDEDLSKFDHLRDAQLFNERFKLVTQKQPTYRGISNINMQIASTNAGLDAVANLNLDYAIKSRTDQCLFDPMSLKNLKALLGSYPSSRAHGRIVGLSLNSFLFRPYGLSDMFQFGRFSDIQAYWNVPFDMRTLDDFDPIDGDESLRQYAKRTLCEIFVATQYLTGKGETLDYSLSQSLEMYRDYFILADTSLVDLIWDKYTYNANRWRADSFPSPFEQISFGHWLNLQNGLDYYLCFESCLDLPVSNGYFA